MIAKELAEALISAQSAFASPKKKAQNPFFNTSYADLEACIDAVIDALHANGIALIQHTGEHDKGVVVSTVFLHKSGAIYEAGSIFVPAAQNTAQAFGSALTYARRYSLMAACGIAPEDDDGNAASRQASKFEKAKSTIGDENVWATVIEPSEDMWGGGVNIYAQPDYRSSANVSANAPSCAHGSMTLKEGMKDGKPYKGYTCPEKDRANQCPARWMIMSKSTGEWRFKDGE